MTCPDLWCHATRFLFAGVLIAILGQTHASVLIAEEIGGAYFWGSFEEAVDPSPNLLHDTSASFFWAGRVYTLYATDAPGVSARLVLEAAISEIAPGLALDCFHRLTTGSWDELAAAGLGDPRGTIPPDFSPNELRLLYYVPPSATCPGAVKAENLPTVFFASFDHPSGRQLELRAQWGETAASTQPGMVSDSSAEWRNGHLTFSVAVAGNGFGEDVVTAIAKALDPSFEAACHRRVLKLSDTQLTSYGFRVPVAPPGFERVTTKQTARLSPGGCSKGSSDPGELDLAWVFTSADDIVLEIGAGTASEASKVDLLIGEDYVRWTDAGGTAYYVYGHSLDEGPGLSQAELFAVARSLDPSVPLPDH